MYNYLKKLLACYHNWRYTVSREALLVEKRKDIERHRQKYRYHLDKMIQLKRELLQDNDQL